MGKHGGMDESSAVCMNGRGSGWQGAQWSSLRRWVKANHKGSFQVYIKQCPQEVFLISTECRPPAHV